MNASPVRFEGPRCKKRSIVICYAGKRMPSMQQKKLSADSTWSASTEASKHALPLLPRLSNWMLYNHFLQMVSDRFALRSFMHVQVQCSSSFKLLAALRTADDLLATCEVVFSKRPTPSKNTFARLRLVFELSWTLKHVGCAAEDWQHQAGAAGQHSGLLLDRQISSTKLPC